MKSEMNPTLIALKIARSAKTNTRRIHITSRSNGWAVRKEGNKIHTIVKRTQREAIEYARNLVKLGQGSKVVVHRSNGTIAR